MQRSGIQPVQFEGKLSILRVFYGLCPPEYMRLAGLSESKRRAYAYIRFDEGKVRVSKRRYDELVKEGYAAMTSAIKNLGGTK